MSDAPQPDERAASASTWARLRRVAVALLAGAGLLILAVGIVAKLYLTDARLTALVNGLVSDAIGGAVVIGTVHWASPLSVQIDDLVLSTAAGVPVATVEHAEASLSLAALGARTIGAELAVRGLTLHVAQPEGGQLSLLDAVLPATTSTPTDDGPSALEGWTIRVEPIVLADAEVLVDVPGAKARIDVQRLEVGAELAMPVLRATADLAIRAIEVEVPALPVGPFTVELTGATIELSAADAHASIHRLDVRTDGASVSLGATAQGLTADTLRADVSGQIDVAIDAFTDLLPPVLGAAGRLHGPFTAKGGLAAATATIDLAGDRLIVAATSIPRIAAAASIAGDTVVLDRLDVGVGDGSARATATVVLPPGAPRHRATVSVRALPLRRLASAFLPDASVVPARLDGTIDVRGAGDLAAPSSHVGVHLAATGLAPALAAKRVKIDGNAHVNLARAVLDDLQVTGGGMTLVATGTVPIAAQHPAALAVSLVHEAAGRITAALKLPIDVGRVTADATLSGTLAAPSITADLTAGGITTAGLPAAAVATKATLANGVARIIDGTIDIAGGTVLVDASARVLTTSGDVVTDPALEGTVHIARIRVGDFVDDLATGALGGDVRIGGRAKSPSVQADLRIDGLSAGSASFSELTAVATLEGDQATLRRLRLRPAAGGTVTASGTFALTSQRLSGALAIRDVPLGLVNQLQPDTPQLEGTLAANASMSGTVKRPQLAARITAGRVTVSAHELGTVSATVAGGLDTLRATVGLKSSIGDALASLDAQPNLQRASARLVANRISPMAGVTLTTAATAAIDLRGGVRAHAAVDRLDLDIHGEPLALAAPATIRFAGDTLTVGQMALEGAGTSLVVQGTAGETIDFTAKGKLDASLANPFVTAVTDIRGHVLIDLAATGPRDQPQLAGTVTIGEGGIGVRPRLLIRQIRVNRGTIRLAGDTVHIEGVSGAIRGGGFQTRGVVALKGLTPDHFDIELTGQNLPLATADLSLEGNADLRLTGSIEAPRISGTLDLVRGRYLRSLALDDFTLVFLEPDLDAGPSERSPFLDKLDVDVRATSQRSMDIDVDAAALAVKSQFGATLHVTGTAGRPLVEGRVTSNTGYIGFPAGRLGVQSIIVDFVPNAAAKIDPRIDVVATGEITPEAAPGLPEISYLVTMTLTGHLSSMQLELESTPGLSRVEVLSLLVTGTANVEELLARKPDDPNQTQDERDQENLRTALVFAGSALTGPLTGFISDQLEERLYLKVKLGAEVTDEDIKVSAEHELHPRIRLEGSYRQAYDSDRTTTSARGRFMVTDEVFIEGGADDTRGTGTSDDATEGWIRLKVRVLGED